METSGCFLCHRPATLTCPSSDLKFCGPEHQVSCFFAIIAFFSICLSSDLKFCGPEHQELCLMLLLLSFCLFVFWPQVLQIRTSDIVYVDLFAMHVWYFRVCSLCGPSTRSEPEFEQMSNCHLRRRRSPPSHFEGKRFTTHLIFLQSFCGAIGVKVHWHHHHCHLDILVIITTNIKAKGMRLK